LFILIKEEEEEDINKSDIINKNDIVNPFINVLPVPLMSLLIIVVCLVSSLPICRRRLVVSSLPPPSRRLVSSPALHRLRCAVRPSLSWTGSPTSFNATMAIPLLSP
jgi:hypothetical protein